MKRVKKSPLWFEKNDLMGIKLDLQHRGVKFWRREQYILFPLANSLICECCLDTYHNSLFACEMKDQASEGRNGFFTPLQARKLIMTKKIMVATLAATIVGIVLIIVLT